MATGSGGSKGAWIAIAVVAVVVILYFCWELNTIHQKVDEVADRLNTRPKVDPKDAPPIDVTPEGVKDPSSAIVAPVQSENPPETRILAESRIHTEKPSQNPPLPPKTLEMAQIQKPQNHSEVSQNAQSESSRAWEHSEDFRVVSAFGKTWNLTLYQSRAVEKLWKAWDNRVPEMHQAAILEGIEACSKRLRDVFKSNMEAYRALITTGERKGTFRLNIA